ncbi:MAG: hypothetical protein QXP72_00285 [Desulfurococcaceae archaeon]
MLLKCPKCGFRFDITYSRAFSCGGCPYVTFGNCNYVKCPKCGFEDYVEKFRVDKETLRLENIE